MLRNAGTFLIELMLFFLRAESFVRFVTRQIFRVLLPLSCVFNCHRSLFLLLLLLLTRLVTTPLWRQHCFRASERHALLTQSSWRSASEQKDKSRPPCFVLDLQRPRFSSGLAPVYHHCQRLWRGRTRCPLHVVYWCWSCKTSASNWSVLLFVIAVHVIAPPTICSRKYRHKYTCTSSV